MKNAPSSRPELLAARRARSLRITGVLVLTLGVAGAGLVYWFGERQAALLDDPAMLGFNRAAHRQMGLFYGKSGYLVDDLLNALSRIHVVEKMPPIGA